MITTIKEKALHAFSSIRKQTVFNNLNPDTASQILDTMIFPILSYNSEVRAMCTKQDFKKWDSSPIEKIHLKFCKRYLQVNNRPLTQLAELNLVDCRCLSREIKTFMNYFVYRNNNDKDSIIKHSFLMSKNLHSMNNSGYYCKFINMFEQYNLTSLDTESLDNDKIGRYTTEMREKYPLSFLRHSLEN